MSIFHCAHSKGLEFSAICLDVTVDVITSRSRAICMDVSLDVNFRGPALARACRSGRGTHCRIPVVLTSKIDQIFSLSETRARADAKFPREEDRQITAAATAARPAAQEGERRSPGRQRRGSRWRLAPPRLTELPMTTPEAATTRNCIRSLQRARDDLCARPAM